MVSIYLAGWILTHLYVPHDRQELRLPEQVAFGYSRLSLDRSERPEIPV